MDSKLLTATRAPLADMVRIVGALSLHVSTDAARGSLCTISFTAGTVKATDTYTAAIFTPDTAIATGDELLVNGRELLAAITNANKVLKRDGSPIVELVSDGRTWQLTATGATATSTASGLVHGGEYPNVAGIVKNTAADKPGGFIATGLNSDYLGRVADAHNKITGKADTPLVLSHWITNTKPMLWQTSTDIGTLEQLLMPRRLS